MKKGLGKAIEWRGAMYSGDCAVLRYEMLSMRDSIVTVPCGTIGRRRKAVGPVMLLTTKKGRVLATYDSLNRVLMLTDIEMIRRMEEMEATAITGIE